MPGMAGAVLRTVVVAHPSPDIYGSDRMLVESVASLTGHFRVLVVLPAGGPLVALLADVGAEVVIRPFPVLRKALLSPSGMLRLFGHTCWALPRLIRLLRQRRPAVVYVNTLTIPVWLAAGRLVRTSVICHVHEAEEAVNPLIRRALVLPLLLANRVLTNSRSSRDTLERAGFRRAGRVQVVYNGVPGPPEITPLTTTQPGKLVVVGRLSPRKGTDIAIRATVMLHEQGFSVSLTLVGGVFSGYEWFETQLRGMAAGWPVRFAGIQNPVWPWLAEADIVVVPSRWEPFGNTAVEGMLAGRPVVASSVQGLTEIVRPGQTGLLVPPDDPAALAATIAALLDDWPRAKALAAAGRQDARDRFSTARYQAEILAVVEEVGCAGTTGQRHPLARSPD
jgi:glycosyltransferase involved in cell wall biosynthesis